MGKVPKFFSRSYPVSGKKIFLNSVGKRSEVKEVLEDLIGLIEKFNTDRERSNEEIWKGIQSLTTAVQELATARRNENPWNPPPEQKEDPLEPLEYATVAIGPVT